MSLLCLSHPFREKSYGKSTYVYLHLLQCLLYIKSHEGILICTILLQCLNGVHSGFSLSRYLTPFSNNEKHDFHCTSYICLHMFAYLLSCPSHSLSHPDTVPTLLRLPALCFLSVWMLSLFHLGFSAWWQGSSSPPVQCSIPSLPASIAIVDNCFAWRNCFRAELLGIRRVQREGKEEPVCTFLMLTTIDAQIHWLIGVEKWWYY